jgi:hypothetical protein
MACNAEKSFFTLAEQLQTKWDIRFKKLLTDIWVSSARIASATEIGSVDMVSLQDKRNFNKMLHRITAKALGQVLVYVEKKAPTALTRHAAEDAFELNADAIPPSVMRELIALLKMYVDHLHSALLGLVMRPPHTSSSHPCEISQLCSNLIFLTQRLTRAGKPKPPPGSSVKSCHSVGRHRVESIIGSIGVAQLLESLLTCTREFHWSFP